MIMLLQYDAGADGWGGHLVVNGVEHHARGAWAPDERHGQKSSTWRELEGLYRSLLSVGHLLRGSRVIARGDALNVFYLLERGGSKAEHLQRICLCIFWLCRSLQIDLTPNWVPRDQNQLADYLSKFRDLDDFGLQPSAFQQIVEQFGKLDVDRFASEHLMLFYQFSTLKFGLLGPLAPMLSHSTGLVVALLLFPASPRPSRFRARSEVRSFDSPCRIGLTWPVLVAGSGRGWAPSCATLCVFLLDMPLSVPVAVPLRRSLDKDIRCALPLSWTSPSLGKCLNIFSYLFL